MNFNRITPDFRPIGPSGQIMFADPTKPYGVGWKWNLDRDAINTDITFDASSTENSLSEIYLMGTGVVNPSFAITTPADLSGILITWNGGSYTNAPVDYDNVLASGFSAPTGFTPSTPLSFTILGSGKYGYSSPATWTISYGDQIYDGVRTTSGTYDQVFIKTLGLDFIAAGRTSSINVSSTSGQYVFWAQATSRGTPKFTDSSTSLAGGFQLISSGISLTNAAGYTQNYQLWRSDSDNLGSRTITIS